MWKLQIKSQKIPKRSLQKRTATSITNHGHIISPCVFSEFAGDFPSNFVLNQCSVHKNYSKIRTQMVQTGSIRMFARHRSRGTNRLKGQHAANVSEDTSFEQYLKDKGVSADHLAVTKDDGTIVQPETFFSNTFGRDTQPDMNSPDDIALHTINARQDSDPNVDTTGSFASGGRMRQRRSFLNKNKSLRQTSSDHDVNNISSSLHHAETRGPSWRDTTQDSKELTTEDMNRKQKMREAFYHMSIQQSKSRKQGNNSTISKKNISELTNVSANGIMKTQSGQLVAPKRSSGDTMMKYNEDGLAVLPSGKLLLDASEDELLELGFNGILSRPELLDTVPDGLNTNKSVQAVGENIKLNNMLDSDASEEEKNELARLKDPNAQLKPYDEDNTQVDTRQTNQDEAAFKREELRALLPDGYSRWSDVVRDKNIKRLKTLRQLNENARQRVLDARIPAAKHHAVYAQGTTRAQDAETYLRQQIASVARGFTVGQTDNNSTIEDESMNPSGTQQEERYEKLGYSLLGSLRGRGTNMRQDRMAKHIVRMLNHVLSLNELRQRFPELYPGNLPIAITHARVTADLQTVYIYWTLPIPYTEADTLSKSLHDFTTRNETHPYIRKQDKSASNSFQADSGYDSSVKSFDFKEPTNSHGWQHIGKPMVVKTHFGYGYAYNRGSAVESHYPERYTSLSRHIDKVQVKMDSMTRQHELHALAPGDIHNRTLSGHRGRVARRRRRAKQENDLSDLSPTAQSLFTQISSTLDVCRGELRRALKPYMTTRHIPKLVFFRSIDETSTDTIQNTSKPAVDTLTPRVDAFDSDTDISNKMVSTAISTTKNIDVFDELQRLQSSKKPLTREERVRIKLLLKRKRNSYKYKNSMESRTDHDTLEVTQMNVSSKPNLDATVSSIWSSIDSSDDENQIER